MSKIGFAGLAALIALVLGMSVSFGTRTAQAEVTDTAAVGCELLASAIDGDLGDATVGGDFVAACDGIDAAEVANLADVLGDEDDKLEASDLADAEGFGGNQIEDGLTSGRGTIYIFAFVDDQGVVTFDADSGVTVTVNDDGGGFSADADTNPETCTAADDDDCDAASSGDDGVVVATITDGSADAGDDADVEVFQADNTGATSTETIIVTGHPDEVSIEVLKDPIQVSGGSSDQTKCENESDVSDASQLGDINRTFVRATVTDNDDTELTRVLVGFDSDDDDIASIDSDSGEPADDPKATSGISVDAGAAGVAAFAVVCGGTDTGTASITATINSGAADEEDDSVDVNVVGEPASIALTASPAAIACDGTQTATVTATVTDSDGDNVANGTKVNFSVVALGTANPINTGTTDGEASSTITPLSGATAGVTVIVTSGDAQASIRVDCTPGGAPPGASPTATPGGGVRPPDTGNGGYLGQDSSAGFPLWTLVALALGSVALVAGGLVTRKVSR